MSTTSLLGRTVKDPVTKNDLERFMNVFDNKMGKLSKPV